ncbi:unnamed protein product [Amoebophrya sp. A120]|nr:unnamed protein product [Amoebophrya sp. A120]|eukprot:GSA120T00022206001.1
MPGIVCRPCPCHCISRRRYNLAADEYWALCPGRLCCYGCVTLCVTYCHSWSVFAFLSAFLSGSQVILLYSSYEWDWSREWYWGSEKSFLVYLWFIFLLDLVFFELSRRGITIRDGLEDSLDVVYEDSKTTTRRAGASPLLGAPVFAGNYKYNGGGGQGEGQHQDHQHQNTTSMKKYSHVHPVEMSMKEMRNMLATDCRTSLEKRQLQAVQQLSRRPARRKAEDAGAYVEEERQMNQLKIASHQQDLDYNSNRNFLGFATAQYNGTTTTVSSYDKNQIHYRFRRASLMYNPMKQVEQNQRRSCCSKSKSNCTVLGSVKWWMKIRFTVLDPTIFIFLSTMYFGVFDFYHTYQIGLINPLIASEHQKQGYLSFYQTLYYRGCLRNANYRWAWRNPNDPSQGFAENLITDDETPLNAVKASQEIFLEKACGHLKPIAGDLHLQNVNGRGSSSFLQRGRSWRDDGISNSLYKNGKNHLKFDIPTTSGSVQPFVSSWSTTEQGVSVDFFGLDKASFRSGDPRGAPRRKKRLKRNFSGKSLFGSDLMEPYVVNEQVQEQNYSSLVVNSSTRRSFSYPFLSAASVVPSRDFHLRRETSTWPRLAQQEDQSGPRAGGGFRGLLPPGSGSTSTRRGADTERENMKQLYQDSAEKMFLLSTIYEDGQTTTPAATSSAATTQRTSSRISDRAAWDHYIPERIRSNAGAATGGTTAQVVVAPPRRRRKNKGENNLDNYNHEELQRVKNARSSFLSREEVLLGHGRSGAASTSPFIDPRYTEPLANLESVTGIQNLRHRMALYFHGTSGDALTTIFLAIVLFFAWGVSVFGGKALPDGVLRRELRHIELKKKMGATVRREMKMLKNVENQNENKNTGGERKANEGDSDETTTSGVEVDSASEQASTPFLLNNRHVSSGRSLVSAFSGRGASSKDNFYHYHTTTTSTSTATPGEYGGRPTPTTSGSRTRTSRSGTALTPTWGSRNSIRKAHLQPNLRRLVPASEGEKQDQSPSSVATSSADFTYASGIEEDEDHDETSSTTTGSMSQFPTSGEPEIALRRWKIKTASASLDGDDKVHQDGTSGITAERDYDKLNGKKQESDSNTNPVSEASYSAEKFSHFVVETGMDFFMSCVCGCLNCGDLKTSMAFGNFQEAGTRLTFGDAVIGMMLAPSSHENDPIYQASRRDTKQLDDHDLFHDRKSISKTTTGGRSLVGAPILAKIRQDQAALEEYKHEPEQVIFNSTSASARGDRIENGNSEDHDVDQEELQQAAGRGSSARIQQLVQDPAIYLFSGQSEHASTKMTPKQQEYYKHLWQFLDAHQQYAYNVYGPTGALGSQLGAWPSWGCSDCLQFFCTYTCFACCFPKAYTYSRSTVQTLCSCCLRNYKRAGRTKKENAEDQTIIHNDTCCGGNALLWTEARQARDVHGAQKNMSYDAPSARVAAFCRRRKRGEEIETPDSHSTSKKIPDFDLIYADFDNSGYKKPVAVICDHHEKTFVIAIRGTMSGADVVTDIDVEFDLIDEQTDPTTEYFHGGCLQAANAVFDGLMENGVLPSVYTNKRNDPQKKNDDGTNQETQTDDDFSDSDSATQSGTARSTTSRLKKRNWVFDFDMINGFVKVTDKERKHLTSDGDKHYRIVLVGHSLGSGVATCLSFLMRRRYYEKMRGLRLGGAEAVNISGATSKSSNGRRAGVGRFVEKRTISSRETANSFSSERSRLAAELAKKRAQRLAAHNYARNGAGGSSRSISKGRDRAEAVRGKNLNPEGGSSSGLVNEDGPLVSTNFEIDEEEVDSVVPPLLSIHADRAPDPVALGHQPLTPSTVAPRSPAHHSSPVVVASIDFPAGSVPTPTSEERDLTTTRIDSRARAAVPTLSGGTFTLNTFSPEGESDAPYLPSGTSVGQDETSQDQKSLSPLFLQSQANRLKLQRQLSERALLSPKSQSSEQNQPTTTPTSIYYDTIEEHQPIHKPEPGGISASVYTKRMMKHSQTLLLGPMSATLSPKLAELSRDWCLTVVNHTDIVPRLHVQSLLKIGDRLTKTLWNFGDKVTKFQVMLIDSWIRNNRDSRLLWFISPSTKKIVDKIRGLESGKQVNFDFLPSQELYKKNLIRTFAEMEMEKRIGKMNRSVVPATSAARNKNRSYSSCCSCLFCGRTPDEHTDTVDYPADSDVYRKPIDFLMYDSETVSFSNLAQRMRVDCATPGQVLLITPSYDVSGAGLYYAPEEVGEEEDQDDQQEPLDINTKNKQKRPMKIPYRKPGLGPRAWIKTDADKMHRKCCSGGGDRDKNDYAEGGGEIGYYAENYDVVWFTNMALATGSIAATRNNYNSGLGLSMNSHPQTQSMRSLARVGNSTPRDRDFFHTTSNRNFSLRGQHHDFYNKEGATSSTPATGKSLLQQKLCQFFGEIITTREALLDHLPGRQQVIIAATIEKELPRHIGEILQIENDGIKHKQEKIITGLEHEHYQGPRCEGEQAAKLYTEGEEENFPRSSGFHHDSTSAATPSRVVASSPASGPRSTSRRKRHIPTNFVNRY